VPDDSYAALSNYKWAAYLGHTKAAFFAGNLLYAQASARNARLFGEAAEYYHQAALGGIVEAMNSYAILLEDGRASEVGLRNLHLAAAWFYQACIERERLEKAHVNLAMLLCNTPLSSFRTVPGDIVTLLDAKDFLLNYFESEAYADEESRPVMLQMVDGLDEHSRAALPLVEEVSQSLSSLRRSVRATEGRYDRPRSPVGPKVVTLTEEDEEHPVDVKRIPLSLSSSADRNYSNTTRVTRGQEEVHRLSRGPIQNQGRTYAATSASEAAQVDGPFAPQGDTAPPVHGHHRSGELYTTDGPVIPPSFVPRAVQFNAPSFKPDKPPPHTKPTARPAPPISSDTAARAPSVPVLTSPKRGAPAAAPRPLSSNAKLFASAGAPLSAELAPTAQQPGISAPPVQRSMSEPSSLQPPPQSSAEPQPAKGKSKRLSVSFTASVFSVPCLFEITVVVAVYRRLRAHGEVARAAARPAAVGGGQIRTRKLHPDYRRGPCAPYQEAFGTLHRCYGFTAVFTMLSSSLCLLDQVWNKLKGATGVSKSLDVPRGGAQVDQRMTPTAAAASSSTAQSVSLLCSVVIHLARR
jgi:hypothetical protein